MTVPYKWLVATAFISGLFMDLTDATIVNVALPTLGRDFGASINTLEWVVTGYLVSLAVWIPASGWIGDRFGTKKTFAFALAMFTLSSVLCGLAWSAGSLIAFRILQGIGGGMMTPVGTTMLFRAFPAIERAKAAAVITIPTAIAPAIGPVLGGWLVEYASWRWIFYVNVPVGVAALIFTLLFLREHKEPAVGAFDVWGFLCSGGGLALLLFALSQAPSLGWTSPQILLSGLAGIALLVALVVIELHQPSPILHIRLFRDRMFRSANLAMFMVTAMLFGVLFLLPLFLQQLRGLSVCLRIDDGPTGSGTPAHVAAVQPALSTNRSAADAGGRAGRDHDHIRVVPAGRPQTNLWWVRGIMFLRGVFMSIAFVASQAATFSTISSEETGRASALFNTNRQVAASLGVAILATVLSQEMQAHRALGAAPGAVQSAALLAFHAAFAASIAFGLLGIFFALRIHDDDAVPVTTLPAG
jgi:MFS family permease